MRLGGANRLTAPAGWIYAVEAGVYLLIKLACTYSLFVQALALKSQAAIEGECCAECSRIPLVKKNGYGGTMFWGESQFSSQTSDVRRRVRRNLCGKFPQVKLTTNDLIG